MTEEIKAVEENAAQQPTGAESRAVSTGTENQAQEFVIDGDAEEAQAADVETNAESEPAPEQKTKAPEKAINQESVQRKIDKAIKEKYEERRRREEAELQLEKARKQLLDAGAKSVTVPEMPDPFDPDFDSKVKARDEALRRAAVLAAEKDHAQQMQEKALRDRAETEQQQINGYVDAMFKSAKSLGIDEKDLRQADDTVAMFIKDAGLAKFILSQKEAPLIINHLAANVGELESISQMNPIEAAAHIATSVIPAARNFKAGLPSTPDPIGEIAGKNKGATLNPYLKGVEFE